MSIGNAFCFSPLSNRLTSFYLAIVVLLAVLFIGKFLRPALKLRTDVKVQRVTLLLVIVADVVARVRRLGTGQGEFRYERQRLVVEHFAGGVAREGGRLAVSGPRVKHLQDAVGIGIARLATRCTKKLYSLAFIF